MNEPLEIPIKTIAYKGGVVYQSILYNRSFYDVMDDIDHFSHESLIKFKVGEVFYNMKIHLIGTQQMINGERAGEGGYLLEGEKIVIE